MFSQSLILDPWFLILDVQWERSRMVSGSGLQQFTRGVANLWQWRQALSWEVPDKSMKQFFKVMSIDIFIFEFSRSGKGNLTQVYINSGEGGLDGGVGGLWKSDDTLALKCYRCHLSSSSPPCSSLPGPSSPKRVWQKWNDVSSSSSSKSMHYAKAVMGRWK